jgi:hypothetical protein
MNGARVVSIYVLATDQRKAGTEGWRDFLCEKRGKYRGLGHIAVSLQPHF